jgi:hypothetical protein
MLIAAQTSDFMRPQTTATIALNVSLAVQPGNCTHFKFHLGLSMSYMNHLQLKNASFELLSQLIKVFYFSINRCRDKDYGFYGHEECKLKPMMHISFIDCPV